MHITDDTPPAQFVAYAYPNGMFRICVENSGDEEVGGIPLLSFHEYSGVEIGASQIFAAGGEPVLMLFAGTYEEQLAIFRAWEQHAEENERPRVFVESGIEALVKLGPAINPRWPDVDVQATERANKAIRATNSAEGTELTKSSREAVRQNASEPASLDCPNIGHAICIAEDVDAELADYPA